MNKNTMILVLFFLQCRQLKFFLFSFFFMCFVKFMTEELNKTKV